MQFFKKIFIVFFSRIVNLCKGYGFTDSLYLINESFISVNNEINKYKVECVGDIVFNQDEIEQLKKIFSTINKLKNFYSTREVTIDGKDLSITRLGRNEPVFELDTFPNIVFKFFKYGNDLNKKNQLTKNRYYSTKEAKKLCEEFSLTKLLVPECSLIHFTPEDLFVIAERKYVLPNDEMLEFEKFESELGEIIDQLTILICKTGFSDVKFNNIPLIHYADALRILLVDLEPIEGRGVKDGLLGWFSRSTEYKQWGAGQLHYRNFLNKLRR